MKRRVFIRRLAAALFLGATVKRIVAEEKPAADAGLVLWKDALRERRVVTFSYHGFAREVEPHALGRLVDDKRAVHAYQVAGGSATEPPPGWRTFVVAEMKAVKLSEKTFARPRADYRRGALKVIEAEVAGAGAENVRPE